jgi:hypothetical protein
MKPPPDALGRVSAIPTTAEQARTRARVREAARERRQIERLRARALLLQCSECGATATGRLTHRGILESQGIKVEHGRHTRSAGEGGRCGGIVRVFDAIEDDEGTAA